MKRTISLTAVRPYSTPACRPLALKFKVNILQTSTTFGGSTGESFDDDDDTPYFGN